MVSYSIESYDSMARSIHPARAMGLPVYPFAPAHHGRWRNPMADLEAV
jgi:hypothetical protein